MTRSDVRLYLNRSQQRQGRSAVFRASGERVLSPRIFDSASSAISNQDNSWRRGSDFVCRSSVFVMFALAVTTPRRRIIGGGGTSVGCCPTPRLATRTIPALAADQPAGREGRAVSLQPPPHAPRCRGLDCTTRLGCVRRTRGTGEAGRGGHDWCRCNDRAGASTNDRRTSRPPLAQPRAPDRSPGLSGRRGARSRAFRGGARRETTKPRAVALVEPACRPPAPAACASIVLPPLGYVVDTPTAPRRSHGVLGHDTHKAAARFAARIVRRQSTAPKSATRETDKSGSLARSVVAAPAARIVIAAVSAFGPQIPNARQGPHGIPHHHPPPRFRSEVSHRGIAPQRTRRAQGTLWTVVPNRGSTGRDPLIREPFRYGRDGNSEQPRVIRRVCVYCAPPTE